MSPHESPRNQKYYAPYNADPTGVLMVDFLPGSKTPYANALLSNGKWIDPPSQGGLSKIGDTDPPSPAEFEDRPWSDSVRKGKGDIVKHFETGIMCADTNKLIGTLQWGFVVQDSPNSVPVVWKGSNADISSAGSDQFWKAVNQFNSSAAPGQSKIELMQK